MSFQGRQLAECLKNAAAGDNAPRSRFYQDLP